MSDPNCQIYLITPPSLPDLPEFLDSLDQALTAAPIACLQIRLKNIEDSALIQTANAIIPICQTHHVAVILNDRPDLVKEIGADGVHIGQQDMDYFSSRELLGEDAIIGVTCHNSKELAFEAASAGASYVAFGVFFDTSTKTPKFRAETEILTWWDTAIETPCVAIGGINTGNAAQVIQAGADFIAVSSGVWGHPNGPDIAVQQLYQLCLQQPA